MDGKKLLSHFPLGVVDDAFLRPLFAEEPFVIFDLKTLVVIYRTVTKLPSFSSHFNFSEGQFFIV